MMNAVARHEEFAPYIWAETIVPYFQPIACLRTGTIVGFEALARLEIGGKRVMPDQFLPDMSPDVLVRLFCTMIGKAIGFLAALAPQYPDLYASVNVESSLLKTEGFIDALRCTLDRHGFAGENLVIELLEGDAIVDIGAMRESLSRIRALGIAVALDDLGSAYSSLINLRDLPIDIIKLDQSFARGLSQRPEDLHYVLSFLSLARGIGKRLIVEGVETFEIQDALRVLGIEAGQGFAIARPMREEDVAPWLAQRRPQRPDRVPRTLLGTYAAHLLVVETCRVVMNQPLEIAWKEESKNPHSCAIGKYFDQNGLHETEYGEAHKRFHAVMACCDTDLPLWQSGADGFETALRRAVAAEAESTFRCDVCESVG